MAESHTGRSAASLHSHSNNIRTIGLGEFAAVLNGVEFKTRHNDYRLFMPHRTKPLYHAVEAVPFPKVPPAVLNKKSIDGQIAEMKEWFKAWRDEDASKRNYTEYFRPVLCYLEGTWTYATKKIDEPFKSDRHFIDASSWMNLQEKVRFAAYTGSKSLRENFSFLPTKIMGFKDGKPIFGQWNYRILCHPLKDYLSKKELIMEEDLSSRMMTGRGMYKHMVSRAARFRVSTGRKNDLPYSGRVQLDDLMGQIPGKDNYQGKLYDDGIEGSEVMNEDDTKKDVSRYHRLYKVTGRDAMGTSNLHRGYSDDFLFAAMNSQQNVAGMNYNKCKREKQANGKYKRVCRNIHQKWSYAIPLEIIYLTPLSQWNPYHLKYHGDTKRGNPSTAGGRYGDCNPDKKKELNGTSSRKFYQTPSQFYAGGNVGRTSADTTRVSTCVLDQEGVVRKVRAAGIYPTLPHIKGVGALRQRYPIFPVHGEGSSVWKELNALRDMVMNPEKWKEMFVNIDTFKENARNETTLYMSASRSPKTTAHTHTLELTIQEVLMIKGGNELEVETSLANGHQHKLRVRWDSKNQRFFYKRCGSDSICWDRHRRVLLSEESF